MHSQPYRRIPLRRRDGIVRAHVIVDAADFEWLDQWRWCLLGTGYACRNEYLGGGRTKERTRLILMHRLILGLVPGDRRQADHINGDRLDNRRANLRVLTHRQNQQNRTGLDGQNTSGYRGVSRTKDKRKWRAHAQVDGQMYHLGEYEHSETAAAAAAAFRREHMPYAREDPRTNASDGVAGPGRAD